MSSLESDFGYVLNELYEQYKRRGYITEDEILNCGCPTESLSDLTDKLLGLGVIIREEKTITDEEIYDASKTDYDRLFAAILVEFPELKKFIKYVNSIVPPQRVEWQQLLPQVKENNSWAKNRLFEMYLRVIVKNAWYHYKTYGTSFLDAIQEGAAGLLYAIDIFDISEHNSFVTYAARAIIGFIRRNCDIPDNEVYGNIPAAIRDNLYKIYPIVDNHFCPYCMCKKRKNECENLQDEIMLTLDCSLKEAIEYLNLCTEHEHEIFDLPDEKQMGAFDRCAQRNLEQVVDRILQELDPKEQFVLQERYSENPKTLEEVGEHIGVTRERVRQIEQKALNKLKHPARAKMLRSFMEPD